MRIITYAIYSVTGLVISRVGDEVYHPVLNYTRMEPGSSFQVSYHYERIPVFDLVPSWEHYTWTKKIPIDIKNFHRKFWGFKPLESKKKSWAY
jgi:hypothetical protein